MVWPLSIVGLVGVIAWGTSAGLTVMESPDEQCEIGEKAESVTAYEYVALELGEAV